jgi:hypothetical protein
MGVFEDLVGGVITPLIKGKVTKAVTGFVTKGYITQAQAPVLVEGVMLEIQVGLDEYKAAQAPSHGAAP